MIASALRLAVAAVLSLLGAEFGHLASPCALAALVLFLVVLALVLYRRHRHQ